MILRRITILENGYFRIAEGASAGNRRGQHNAFQTPAAGQGHIDLAEAECPSGVDDDPVECQALALVYGDGPGCPERVLGE